MQKVSKQTASFDITVIVMSEYDMLSAARPYIGFGFNIAILPKAYEFYTTNAHANYIKTIIQAKPDGILIYN